MGEEGGGGGKEGEVAGVEEGGEGGEGVETHCIQMTDRGELLSEFLEYIFIIMSCNAVH